MLSRQFIYVTSVPNKPIEWNTRKEESWARRMRKIVHTYKRPGKNQPWLDDTLFARPRKISPLEGSNSSNSSPSSQGSCLDNSLLARPKKISPSERSNSTSSSTSSQGSRDENCNKIQHSEKPRKRRLEDDCNSSKPITSKNLLEMGNRSNSSDFSNKLKNNNVSKCDFQRPQKRQRIETCYKNNNSITQLTKPNVKNGSLAKIPMPPYSLPQKKPISAVIQTNSPPTIKPPSSYRIPKRNTPAIIKIESLPTIKLPPPPWSPIRTPPKKCNIVDPSISKQRVRNVNPSTPLPKPSIFDPSTPLPNSNILDLLPPLPKPSISNPSTSLSKSRIN